MTDASIAGFRAQSKSGQRRRGGRDLNLPRSWCPPGRPRAPRLPARERLEDRPPAGVRERLENPILGRGRALHGPIHRRLFIVKPHGALR